MFKKNRILRIRRSLRQARMASKIYVQTTPEAVWNCDYWISKIDLRVYFSTLHKSLTCPVFGLRSGPQRRPSRMCALPPVVSAG